MLLGEGLESIGYYCFGDNNLSKVVIPSTVTYISDGAFESCIHMKQVSFAGEVLEVIGSEAFARSGLEYFIAPASLHELRDSAFMGCENLKYVNLGTCTLRSDNEENYLSDNIFCGSALETIVLPRTLRVIGKSAFEDCKCLKSVSFG